MASIATSISGLFSSLGSGLRGLAEGASSFITPLAPLAELGVSTAAAVQALNRPAPRPQVAAMQAGPVSVRPTGALALPGGAPVMATVSTSPFMTAGLGGVQRSLEGLGQALIPGGSPGPVGCIAPMPTRGGLRLPRLVNVPNPTDPSKIETYVRAPRPRYRVSISGPRRRCRGGR